MLVGLIDSGVGGINILKKLTSDYPGNNYIYISDSVLFPYGEKTKDDLIKRIRYLVEQLIKQGVNLIIFACNTISAIVLDEIKDDYNTKIIGVISLVVDYIVRKNYKEVYLIGSKLLVESSFYQNKLKEHSVKVTSKKCSKLISLIEHQEDYRDELKLCLSNINKNHQAIILACTHFIVFKEYLTKNLEIDVISQDNFEYM